MKHGSRRGTGEGTYEQLPSGLWRLVVRKNGKKTAGPARETKSEARSALNAQKGKGSLSFLKQAQNWLDRQKYAPTTKDIYGYWLVALGRDPLGSIPAGQVTDNDLKQWASRQDLAPVTIQKRLGVWRQILKDAGNPLTFSVRKPDHQRRPLTPRERLTLAERLTGAEDWLKTAVLLGWHCGLRRSEICGLAHEDRDGDGFWVRRVVVITRNKVIVRPRAKTARSHGWVPLPPSLIDLVGDGKGFVVGEGKTPRHPRVLSDAIADLVKGTSLENVPHMGGHALRRTYGMILLESGADIITAAKAMRHSPEMLAREYARSREDLMRDAVKKAFPEVEAPPEATRNENQVPCA